MQVNSKRKKVLSVFNLVMINVIAIDSLRNLPSNAVNGLSIPFFYILATLFFLIPCVLVTAELATHYPKTGGAYVWVRESLGPRWGFMTIWLQWIYNVFWYPTILSFIAANIAYLIDPSLINQKAYMLPMIIGMFLLATLVNCFGMKLSGLISTISAIIGTLVPMALIIVLGAVWLILGKPLAIQPTFNHFIPHINQMHNIAFLVVVLFSLVGLEMSAVHAEEVKNPQRDYPRALAYTSIIIVVSLILSSTAIAIVVPQRHLNIVSGLDQAFNLFLQAYHLGWLLPIIVVCMIIGGFGNMSAWVIGPTKGLMVAAQDGYTPRILASSSKKNVPIAILVFQALVVLLICGLFLLLPAFNTSYWLLSDLTAQFALIFYIFLFIAAIKLRAKTPYQANTFRIPGKKWGLWLTGSIGILACSIAIIIGFIPPDSVTIHSVLKYELILFIGIIVFALPPLILAKLSQHNRRTHSSSL